MRERGREGRREGEREEEVQGVHIILAEKQVWLKTGHLCLSTDFSKEFIVCVVSVDCCMC